MEVGCAMADAKFDNAMFDMASGPLVDRILAWYVNEKHMKKWFHRLKEEEKEKRMKRNDVCMQKCKNLMKEKIVPVKTKDVPAKKKGGPLIKKSNGQVQIAIPCGLDGKYMIIAIPSDMPIDTCLVQIVGRVCRCGECSRENKIDDDNVDVVSEVINLL